MKKAIIISLAACGILANTFGQGSINLDNSTIGPNLTLFGNLYSGTYGMQVYILNSSTLPSNINPFDGNNGPRGFANMLADGYTLEATFTGRTITAQNAGVFSLGQVDLPDISPKGSTECIALAAWTGPGSSFSSGSSLGGVITFINPTADYTAIPQPTPPFLSGWDGLGKDLIMADPEPSMFALAGMSGTALIIFRRNRLARK